MTKKSKAKADNQEKIMKDRIHEGFQRMFTGKGEPLSNMSLQEVETLKSRVAELEGRLIEQGVQPSQDQSVPPAVESTTHASNWSAKKSLPSHHEVDSSTTLEKRIGLWVTGISAALGLAFFSVALYIIFILQNGTMDLSDKVLTPLTLVMFVSSLISMNLVRRDQLVPGLWTPYLTSVILAPVLAILVLQDFQIVAGTYFAMFSFIFVALVLPKTTRWQASFVAIGAALVMAGIEIWNPAFRLNTSHIENFVPMIVGPAAIGILATFIITYQSRNPGIRSRLTTLMVFIMIPLLVGISLIVTSLAGTRMEADAHAELQGISDARASTVSTWLKLNTSALQQLTLQPNIVNMDPEQQRPVLQAMAEAYPYIYLVSTTDMRGVNVARSDDGDLTDYSDRDWFRAARAGLPVSYQSLIGRTTGQPALAVSMPIKNASGNIVGVGMFAAHLTDLAEETQVSGMGGRGFTYIVDAKNKALAHPDEGYTAELRDMSSYPPVAALRQGKTGLIIFTDEHGEHWHAYGIILSNGWAIIAQRPESEILGPARQFQIIVLLLIIAGGALMLVLTWLTIRRTLQPIQTLTENVSAIAAGNLNSVVEVNSRDEIGKLAHTFNGMTDQIRSLVESLEQRVADRTHDLELASEVGRTVTEKMANAGEMLTTAVEMIRSRFELYYTQVYLTDATGQKLMLRAGTGEVGKELLQRGHSLLINSGSLNGRAATEKRAVIVTDTKDHPSFLPNPLLPNTRSEMAIPLIVAGKVVGVLDMQSEQPGALNESNLPAFQALAGQLAIAVENAALFAQAEESRVEVEAQVRRLAEHGWQDFLNAIDRAQKIGFTFDQSKVTGLNPEGLSTKPNDRGIRIPITITGTKVGEIHLPVENDRTWTNHELELVRATSVQLAQHIDSLRLIAQADQYRSEAEQAIRRLTREGWETYRQLQAEMPAGFAFDLIEVQPLQANGNGHSPKIFTKPLLIRGETIGELAVEDVDYEDEASEIISGVAQQLSGHIENLRLLETTEYELAERTRTEQELLKVRLGMDRAMDAVFMTDSNGTILYVNPAFERIYGWTREEAIGQTPRIIKSGMIPPERYKEFWNTLLGNQVVTGEIINKTKDGRLIPIEASNSPIVDANGNIIGFLGLHRDITERKQAEEAIKAEQQRVHLILESVTIPMVITRLSDNHLTFVNAPAIELTQFKYEDVINHPSPDFYVNLGDRKNILTELQANGRVSDKVVRLRGENGKAFWALLSARVFDYEGETSILTTFMDITDRIRAEESVAKRASELQTVAEVSTTTATTLEPDRLLQSVVDLTKEQFGLYHAHIYLANESWNTLLLAAGAGEVGRKMVAEGWNIPLDHPSSIVADAARNRKSVIANDVYHDKESSFLSNRLLPDTRSEMAVPIIVGDKLLGVFDVQSDIVGRFTEEDANIYITLASQIGVALQNARLYAEQSATLTQLRELDRLKSSFLANMSHELRTPLNSILGFADVMLEGIDGELTEFMDNDLHLIQKNGKHLLHLINDVLDMAKIESGRMNLNPEKFKIHDMLEEVVSITSTLASEKNLSLFIADDSDQEIEIYADNTRLRQVMINVVNNAIKFTEKGKIVISTQAMEDARALITVTDTGIGIPPDKLEAIFQEFTQVDSSSTRKAGGTGLGLPISRRLVEMHGGRLWADSTGILGEGSTFFVELPLEARITEVVAKQER